MQFVEQKVGIVCLYDGVAYLIALFNTLTS